MFVSFKKMKGVIAMRKGKSKAFRILCLLLLVVMIMPVSLTGCSQTKDTNSRTGESPAADKDAPAAVFSVDVDYVSVPAEGAEVAQTLNLKSSAAIDGTLNADDITLGGSFENMKVSDVSNDSETITLTVSGVPVLEGASTLGYLGEIEMAGRYFDSDQAVSAGVPVMCMSEEEQVSSYFYPFFDFMVDNDTSKELHIILHPYNGSFVEDFGRDRITFDGVLENAEIVSLEKTDDDNYELVVNVSAELDNLDTESTLGSITLAAGSLTNNEEEISYTREYSIETYGRDLSKADIEKIKDVVNPKKNNPETTDSSMIGSLFGYGVTALDTATRALNYYKTVTTMLGAFGILKSSDVAAMRHQEIMESLNMISGQVKDMQEDVTAIRSYAADNKRALENLSLISTEDYLAGFHAHYDSMIKYTNEIENALTKNRDKILQLAEEYYVEDEEEREMTDDEINDVIEEFGGKICDLKQSNYYTIGQKMMLLEAEYTTAVVYLKNNNANPVSRYCQLYKYTDNFSTTSLVEKELYALDLDCQFDRTLSYLMLLGGKDSQQENINLFYNSYFPDVVAEATNGNGDPYCYLMQSYVQIPNNVASEIYKPGKDVTILHSEDVTEFWRRKNGRSLKEELLRAGFDESSLTEQYTDFNKSDFGSGGGFTDNDRYYGLGFSFKKVSGNYPYGNGARTFYSRMDGMFNYMKDDRNSYTICAEGCYYDVSNTYYDGNICIIPCCGYISKGGSYYTSGWYMIEPLTYLKRV